MPNRPRSDVLKLFAAGVLFTAILLFTAWFLDEKAHLSDRWWRFVMGHLLILGPVLWYMRRLLKTLKAILVVATWVPAHLIISLMAVQHGVPNIDMFIFIPFEAFMITLVLQHLSSHHKVSSRHSQ